MALKNFPDANVLFLCWPPYNTPLAKESLRLFTGGKVIYIGEDQSGCNADDDFFDIINKFWKQVKRIHIPQWEGLRDNLFLYERRT
mgnify:FL=1